jgi:dethiobiotin synthetase
MKNRGYPPTLFILGTDQDIGKTATSMGIISKLLSPDCSCSPDDVGYIKPVGQQTVVVQSPNEGPVTVDKDVLLVTKFYGLDHRLVQPMSPVVWGSGATAEFIDKATRGDPTAARETLTRQIRAAYETVAAGRRVVVCEGTGQPGVGSVAGVSNGDVIKLLRELGVPVITILVSRGGIGSTIDSLFPHLLSLNCMNCPVDGLIINAVRVDKMAKVRDYLERYYREIFPALYCCFSQISLPPPIVGLIPEVPELGFPTMRLLAETFAHGQKKTVEFLSRAQLAEDANAFVRRVKVRSLESGFETYLEDGDAFVVGINANEAIVALLKEHARQKSEGRHGLSGLILSCAGRGGLQSETLATIHRSGVPLLVVPNDSAEVVREIAEMSIKIQPYDLAKKALVDKAYAEYLDFSVLLEKLQC